jgi:formate hydrogenlyase transcriptional activator
MTLLDEVVRTRQPVRLEENAQAILAESMLASRERHPHVFRPEALTAFITRPIETVALYPLFVRDTVVGILCTSFTRKLTADESICLQLCAIQAGAAVERAQLYDSLQGLRTVRPTVTRLSQETRDLADEPIGQSPIFHELLDRVRQFAATDSTVLLIGETGTGKELVARGIHRLSARRGQALVKMNCGAIAPGLIESELFGHEKGAFTGALQRRVGRFELADRGTLFLDEISELPLDGQVKLLRVLQEREFERVGSSESIRVDTRIIAATNRNLGEAVAAGAFRQDLFYRVSVLPIHIPAVRDRPGDIPILVRYFIDHYHRTLGTAPRDVSDDALERLVAYRWPGNVRELKNVIERACVLTTGPMIGVDSLRVDDGNGHGKDKGHGKGNGHAPNGHAPNGHAPNGHALAGAGDGPESFTTYEEHERCYLRRVLASTGGRIEGPNGAAAILAMHPSTLRSRLQRLGIERPERAN